MVQTGDPDRFGLAVVCSRLPDTLALDRVVQAPVLIAFIERHGHVDGQVRAAHHPDGGGPVLDEPERDGVLLVAKEALGPIDRVEGPELVMRGIPGPQIDRIEQIVAIGIIPNFLGGRDRRAEDHGVVFIPQEGRGLLGNHHKLAQLLLEHHRDHRLAGVISDGDGALVVLGDRTDIIETILHLAANDRSGGNGQTPGFGVFCVVDHGDILSS